jgi:hypothetical protein
VREEAVSSLWSKELQGKAMRSARHRGMITIGFAASLALAAAAGSAATVAAAKPET